MIFLKDSEKHLMNQMIKFTVNFANMEWKEMSNIIFFRGPYMGLVLVTEVL